jgi:hypothetical protein
MRKVILLLAFLLALPLASVTVASAVDSGGGDDAGIIGGVPSELGGAESTEGDPDDIIEGNRATFGGNASRNDEPSELEPPLEIRFWQELLEQLALLIVLHR